MIRLSLGVLVLLFCMGEKMTRLVVGVNDLASKSELLRKEWDYEKNLLNPTQVSYGSHKHVWWVCSKCGHSWEAEIKSRFYGNGCRE